MGAPTTALGTLRPEIAASFEEFGLEEDRRNFIGTRVAPVTEVMESGGAFGRIPIEQLLENPDVARAPGTGYHRGKWKFEPDTYVTQEYGHEEPVDRNTAKKYRNYFDAELIASKRAMDIVLRAAEVRWAAKIFNTTTWNGASLTTNISVPWSTIASAVPIADVEAAVNKVYDNSGVWPNTLILTKKAFRYLRRCDQIISLIKYSGNHNPTASGITADVLAEVFDLEQVIVAGGTKNTAGKGPGIAATPASLWDATKAMVCYVAPSGEMSDLSRPTLARTFHWDEDGSLIGGAFESYEDPAIRGQWYRCRHQVGEKIMYKELGHLLTNVT